MKRVLIVEDNKNNMRLIVKLLENEGCYETIKAETGEEGVMLAIKEKPDLILMDIKLPGIDGIETIKQIRASGTDGRILIIALTSYAMAGDREKLMQTGFNGYIEKPLDPYTIIKEIEKICREQTKSS